MQRLVTVRPLPGALFRVERRSFWFPIVTFSQLLQVFSQHPNLFASDICRQNTIWSELIFVFVFSSSNYSFSLALLLWSSAFVGPSWRSAGRCSSGLHITFGGARSTFQIFPKLGESWKSMVSNQFSKFSNTTTTTTTTTITTR